MRQTVAAFAVLLSILLLACNDPTLIGAELLEDDQTSVELTDDFTLTTTTVKTDSVRTYSPTTASQLQTYFCGDFQDPIFGKVRAEIYTQPLLSLARPDFADVVFDSLVLVLPTDTLNFYGPQPAVYGFEVHKVTERMDNSNTYYSNDSFESESNSIGSLTKMINPIQQLTVYDPAADTTFAFAHVRIRLDDALGLELLGLDQDIYSSDTTWTNYFPGVRIQPTTLNSESIIAFNLRNPRGGFRLYYTQGDTAKVYPFPLVNESVKMVNFTHDYSGSVVEPFLTNKDLGDSLVFIQSMAGVETELVLPDLDFFTNTIINKAEIEFTIADLPEDKEGVYPPIEQILASQVTEDGDILLLRDIILSTDRLATVFGGVVVEGESGSPDKYVFNISDYFQDAVRDRASSRLRFSAFLKAQRANRVVLFGGKSSMRPILRVTYTEI